MLVDISAIVAFDDCSLICTVVVLLCCPDQTVLYNAMGYVANVEISLPCSCLYLTMRCRMFFLMLFCANANALLNSDSKEVSLLQKSSSI
jgi:hypothetical protein